MTDEEIAVRLAEHDGEIKRCTRRLALVETEQSALKDIAAGVNYMVKSQEKQEKQLDKLDEKVEALEQKPAKRWDGMVDKIVLCAITALVAFLFARVGI